MAAAFGAQEHEPGFERAHRRMRDAHVEHAVVETRVGADAEPAAVRGAHLHRAQHDPLAAPHPVEPRLHLVVGEMVA